MLANRREHVPAALAAGFHADRFFVGSLLPLYLSQSHDRPRFDHR